MKNKLRNLYVKYLFLPTLSVCAGLTALAFAVGFYFFRYLTTPKQMDELLYRLTNYNFKEVVEIFKDLKKNFDLDGVK